MFYSLLNSFGYWSLIEYHYYYYHIINNYVDNLNITGLHPTVATRYISYVLLVHSPNKFNLLSWL